MRYIAAYMLASMNSEGTTPNADSIKSILGSVGVEADDTQLELIIRLFSNITPQMAIEEGMSLLASMPGGGAGGAPAAAGGAAAADAGAAAPAEEKKPEEPEEESDDDMGFGLFD